MTNFTRIYSQWFNTGLAECKNSTVVKSYSVHFIMGGLDLIIECFILDAGYFIHCTIYKRSLCGSI